MSLHTAEGASETGERSDRGPLEEEVQSAGPKITARVSAAEEPRGTASGQAQGRTSRLLASSGGRPECDRGVRERTGCEVGRERGGNEMKWTKRALCIDSLAGFQTVDAAPCMG